MLRALDKTTSESNTEDQLCISFPYFEFGRPLLSNNTALSVDDPSGASPTNESEKHATFDASGTIEFDHGLAEINQAPMDAGMTITTAQEHDSVPWNALPARMQRGVTGEFTLKKRSLEAPMHVRDPGSERSGSAS